MEQPTPTPYPNSPTPLSQSDERLWAMLAHLVALPGSFVLIGTIVAPLIVWQVQKDKSAFVDYHGKESVNFQITMAIAAGVSFFLFLILVGLVLIWIVGVLWIGFTIIAAIKAYNGEYYRYPLTYRFIK